MEKRLQNVSENNLLEKPYFTYITIKEKERGYGSELRSSMTATAAPRSRLLAQGKNPAFVRGTASQLLLNGEL